MRHIKPLPTKRDVRKEVLAAISVAREKKKKLEMLYVNAKGTDESTDMWIKKLEKFIEDMEKRLDSME